MGYILFLAFLLTPLIEIATFIEVGGLIGLWPTIGIVILTALAGAWLWRLQGLSTLARAQEALNRGELPVQEIRDGAFLLVAGALLLTPGFFTDTIGFLLFLPPVRAVLGRIVFNHLKGRVHVHTHTQGGHPGGHHGGSHHGASGPVIDGDATTLDDEPRG